MWSLLDISLDHTTRVDPVNDRTNVRVTDTCRRCQMLRGGHSEHICRMRLVLDSLSVNPPAGNNQSRPSNIKDASTIPFGL